MVVARDGRKRTKREPENKDVEPSRG